MALDTATPEHACEACGALYNSERAADACFADHISDPSALVGCYCGP